MKQHVTPLALATTLALAGVMPATAQDLTYAIGYPPGSLHVAVAEEFKTYAAENGGLEIEVYPLSLLGLLQIPEGIRDGVVDMGFNAHALFSAEYPNSNLPADINILARDDNDPTQVMLAPAAMAGAITEYIMLHCPECQEEFARDGQVYLSGQSSASYALLCATPVTTLADVQGKQIRTASGYWSRWAEGVGAVGVFMSANEVFTALSQGAVDCVAMSPAELLSLRLIDVVKSITIGVPQGVFSGASVVNIGTDAWRGLDEEARRSLLDAAFFLNANMTFALASNSQRGLDAAREQGIEVLEPAQDLFDATAEMNAVNRDLVAKQYVDVSNVTDIDAKIATINELVGKWLGLMNGVTTRERMHQIYREEIMSKVDLASYGMN